MKKPSLVRDGLEYNFQVGYDSKAKQLLYKQIKKSPEEIAQMIRETWQYIKTEDSSPHIVDHFMYLLSTEIERDWIKDISFEIVEYGLNYNSDEVVDTTIGLIEEWNEKDLLQLLFDTEIKVKWLNDYKKDVLDDYGYVF
jgi:hypothetical protein